MNSKVHLHRIPGPSALLYYENTDIRRFVTTISGKLVIISGIINDFLDRKPPLPAIRQVVVSVWFESGLRCGTGKALLATDYSLLS